MKRKQPRPGSIGSTPFPVRRALAKLGQDIQNARKRRRLTQQIVADRAGISRSTLCKLEKGEGGVSLETLARVLFALGLLDSLQDLADLRNDPVGLHLAEESLPKRVRVKRIFRDVKELTRNGP